jgi:uncharacterized protein YecE (DUF72 family)
MNNFVTLQNVILIGTSGWAYDHWKGIFYEKDASQQDLLSAYADSFRTVEINNTFYGLPSAETVEEWRCGVPDGFTFAVKANRYITHMKNLLEPEQPVARMMGRVRGLGDKLGPILFQLPPGWHVNVERLAGFVDVLPGDRRYAFEFRHKSWYADPVYDVLEGSGCAFCIHDHRDAPAPRRVTADFVYVRFHGRRGGYEGKYLSSDLSAWADTIAGWREEGLDVYGYFNNDYRGYAVENAQELIALLADS